MTFYRLRMSDLLSVRIYKSLSQASQKKIKLLVFLQVVSNIFDLIGVIAVGLLTTFSPLTLKEIPPVLDFLNSNFGKNISNGYALFGTILIAFTLKTVFSIYATRQILRILSREYGEVSSNMISGLIKYPLENEKKITSQETLYIATKGLESAYLLVLAPLLALISDVSLLAILFFAAFLINPALSFFFLAIFALTALIAGRYINKPMKILGSEYANLNIQSNDEILEILSLRKEIVLGGKSEFFISELLIKRENLANVISKASIIPYVTKYLVEAGFLLGTVILGISSVLINDNSTFVVSVTVFLAIGARITPAVLRIQQGLLVMKNNFKIAEDAILLSKSLRQLDSERISQGRNTSSQNEINENFEAPIHFDNVNFAFQESDNVLNNINLNISKNTFVAIVGPSGSGKSTLVNLLLGFLEPKHGSVYISGLSPQQIIEKYPGKIGYVPQEVNLISGSIAQNIALGVPLDQIDELKLAEVISKTSLDSFVATCTNGVNTIVGEKGVPISGGQKQRIGIARALYAEPKLLVLDEATSSLDGAVESDVIRELVEQKTNMTLVVVAHRLSSVREADQIIYIDKIGRHHIGEFLDLRLRIPDFDNQARQLGL